MKEIGPWPRKLRFFRPGHPSYEVVLYAFFTDKGPLFQIGTILALRIKIIFLNLFFFRKFEEWKWDGNQFEKKRISSNIDEL